MKRFTYLEDATLENYRLALTCRLLTFLGAQDVMETLPHMCCLLWLDPEYRNTVVGVEFAYIKPGSDATLPTGTSTIAPSYAPPSPMDTLHMQRDFCVLGSNIHFCFNVQLLNTVHKIAPSSKYNLTNHSFLVYIFLNLYNSFKASNVVPIL